ncbi:potassium-transporting ATPase subunit F [Flavobacterium akiainvivens]
MFHKSMLQAYKPLVMTLLFIVALLVFAYMCYVLVKPEKF